MIKCALLLLSCLTIFAQRTPLSVNGTVVNNPNFTNTDSVTWSVAGPNIRGTASAGSDSFWTNSSVASGSIQPVGGSNVYMPGTLAVVGQLTNDALQASQLVYSGPDKVLSSISPGNSGDVLTSSGPGIAPSFLPVSGGDTIWTNSNGTISNIVAGVSFEFNDDDSTIFRGIVNEGVYNRLEVMPYEGDTFNSWCQMNTYVNNPYISFGGDDGATAGEVDIGINAGVPFFDMLATTKQSFACTDLPRPAAWFCS